MKLVNTWIKICGCRLSCLISYCCHLLQHGNAVIIQPDSQDMLTTHRTLDLTSSLEVGPATNPVAGDSSSCRNTWSVGTIAFQFPFESNLQDNVATMAHRYVQRWNFICSTGCHGHLSIRIDPNFGTKAFTRLSGSGYTSSLNLSEL